MTVCCSAGHQVGFSLHDYIKMHGQQNIKFARKLPITSFVMLTVYEWEK
jgi:hypothetical protein